MFASINTEQVPQSDKGNELFLPIYLEFFSTEMKEEYMGHSFLQSELKTMEGSFSTMWLMAALCLRVRCMEQRLAGHRTCSLTRSTSPGKFGSLVPKLPCSKAPSLNGEHGRIHQHGSITTPLRRRCVQHCQGVSYLGLGDAFRRHYRPVAHDVLHLLEADDDVLRWQWDEIEARSKQPCAAS